MQEENYGVLQLENGLRLVQRKLIESEIIHCGLMINAGSRDENALNNGIAHFIEHTVFKGTGKRKSHYLLTAIEKVGGELNAYTTREKTCFYVSCLKQYADRAVDILSDMTFNASFPEKEIEKEKKVIVDEIEMYEDSPDESIYDDFYALAFNGHALGFNILGTPETVRSFNREMIQGFRGPLHTAGATVLSIVGDLSVKQSTALAEKYLKDIPAGKPIAERIAPFSANVGNGMPYKAFELTKEMDFTQAHCMMGNIAYSKHDPRRFALSLVNNIIGGAGMSSRLNLAVREKHGLTYHISSNYSNYQDTGIFSVYFATDRKQVSRCRELIDRELKKMRTQKLSASQLSQAKVQLLGQIAMIDENPNIHMQSQARSLLDYDRVYSFRDFLRRVDEVTAEQMLEVANEIFDPSQWSTLIYDPGEDNKE
jgi:predicted Zn-dependent peptidase